MLRKVQVDEPGDTEFLPGDLVSKVEFRRANEAATKKGGKPASASPVLLGISRSSLQSESFLAAASFQETTKVLSDAALAGRRDALHGLKENVLMGHVIPAGTGFDFYRKALVARGEPAPELAAAQSQELEAAQAGAE